jgi:membrane associated rhomboid family serine protease
MAAILAGKLDEVVASHGFLPADPWRGGGLTAFSSFFIHGGILHLVFNMWFLIVAGDNCEDLLGAPRYLALLAGGALVALLMHAWLDPRPHVPVVGASGGISALLAFYALALPRVRLVVCLRLGWYPIWIRMKSATAISLWVGGQVIGCIIQLGGQGNVSSIAHLGGALAGVALWLGLRKKAL